MAKEKKEKEPVQDTRREALVALLTSKVYTIFDREPMHGFNGNFDKLVDAILEL